MTRLARFLTYAAAGPITGPLLAGIVRHRKTAPILAGLYAVAMVLAWVDLIGLGKWSAVTMVDLRSLSLAQP